MTTIAVLGTGIMGAPIAHNLATNGFEVRAWNRTRDKADPLADSGVTVTDSPAEAVDGADILLTMLLDADAVRDSVADALAHAPKLWLQCSTVGLSGTTMLSSLADEHDIVYVDAPVLGTKQPAESGELTVLAAGPADVRDRCQPVFDVIGARTVWVGERAGQATRLKLVMNSWVLALTTATAEAMALADGLGLDPKRFLETIEGGPLDAAYAQLKGKAMIRREFPASFPTAGAAKDAGLIVEAGESAGVQLLVADAVRRQMTAAVDGGYAADDMAAVWYAARGSGH